MYEISSIGRIRILVNRRNISTGDLLVQSIDKDGYYLARLSTAGTRETTRSYRVARLVAAAFFGPIPSGMTVNHKNGNRYDDSVGNLEVVTMKANIHHSMQSLGHTRQGEKNPAAKLTEDQVVEIRTKAAAGFTYVELAIRYGVTAVLIGTIVRGEVWANSPGPIGKRRNKPYVKMTPDSVQLIRDRVAQGETHSAVARDYGMSPHSVDLIVARKIWKDMPKPDAE